MKFLSSLLLALVAAAAAEAESNPEPVYRQGTITYEVGNPMALKDFDFDLSGAIENVRAFKTALVAQAWEIVQPAALFFLSAFIFYVFASLAFQLAYGLSSGKLTLFGGAWNWVASTLAGANAALLEKLANVMPEEEDGEASTADNNDMRARRNAAFPSESQLLSLLRGVGEAMTKYD